MTQKRVSAPLGQRLGAEPLGRLRNAVRKLDIVHESLAGQLVDHAVQQRPRGFFGTQRDAFAIDQRDTVSVAVECNAHVGPFPIHGVAEIRQVTWLGAIGRPTAELIVHLVVNR